MDFNELVRLLSNAGNTTRCDELKGWLEATGFTVRDGNRGKHKVFIHNGLRDAGFYSGSYACEHGSNPSVKNPYIRKILNQVVLKYEKELRKYLGEDV